MCVRCARTISWYDNVPLFSFLLLKGKCRSCGKEISKRYFMIEALCGVLFFAVYITPQLSYSIFLLVFSLFMVAVMVAVAVIDIEHMIIPDNLVFAGIFAAVTYFVITDFSKIYLYIFSGLLVSSFLLVLNIITKGSGMGLGDVKLGLLGGIVLGPMASALFVLISFVVGALFGILFLTLGKVHLRQRIAFGPFMAGSFIFVFIFLQWKNFF